MSDIYVNASRFEHPFAPHYKTLTDAFAHVINGDTLHVVGRLHLERGLMLPVRNLRIVGEHCVITVPHGELGLAVDQDGLDLVIEDITFKLGEQTKGIMLGTKVNGNMTLRNVSVLHDLNRKSDVRTLFKGLAVAVRPNHDVAPVHVVLDHYTGDYDTLLVRDLDIKDSHLGTMNTLANGTYGGVNLQVSGSQLARVQVATLGNQTGNITDSSFVLDDTVIGLMNVEHCRCVYPAECNQGNHRVQEMCMNAMVATDQQAERAVITASHVPNTKVTQTYRDLSFDVDSYQSNYVDLRHGQYHWFNLNNASTVLSKMTIPALPTGMTNIASGDVILEYVKNHSTWRKAGDVTVQCKESDNLFPVDNATADSNVTIQHVDALTKLNNMIGLSGAKKAIRAMVDNASMNAELERRGMMPADDINNNMVFAGAPGTGKTTVARLTAAALYEHNVIPKNSLKTVKASDLISGYVGQTAQKTDAVCKDALGGVLFIDEAYVLAPPKNGGNSFNDECVNILIQYAENHRNDLVIIMAGYDDLMKDFFKRGNPGLQRRFPNWITFANYTDDEVLAILLSMLQARHVIYANDTVKTVMSNDFKQLYQAAGRNAGNGGFARNYADQLLKARSSRLARGGNLAALSDTELNTLTLADVKLASQQTQSMNVFDDVALK